MIDFNYVNEAVKQRVRAVPDFLEVRSKENNLAPKMVLWRFEYMTLTID